GRAARRRARRRRGFGHHRRRPCGIVWQAPEVSTMAQEFDLVVIGAGSGGIAASRRAALHGARVAVVEAGRVGGTCVLRGCVPKELLMYAAQFGDALRDAAAYGWAPVTAQFEMSRWAAAKAAE